MRALSHFDEYRLRQGPPQVHIPRVHGFRPRHLARGPSLLNGVGMNPALRGTVRVSTVLLVLFAVGVAASAAVAAAAPPTPADLELHAGADSSITLEWPASPGATSYNIYRGTSAGGEGTTPIASTTDTEYKDSNLSPTPVYFYQI